MDPGIFDLEENKRELLNTKSNSVLNGDLANVLSRNELNAQF